METDQVSAGVWMMLVVMVLLLLGVAIVAISFNLRQHSKLVEQFRRLGEKFDLELTIPKATLGGLYRRNPTLYGRYLGHEMSIYPKGYGLDNTRQTDTAVRITTMADSKLHLTIARRNLTGKMGQIGRLKECKTGDTSFDEVFSLRSNDPAQAVKVFNDQWRAKLSAEWPKLDSFLTLQDGIITHLRSGLPYEDESREDIERMVTFCAALSESF
ncbi:hypothetical protein [Cerasicoccus arenae]|uniref:Uncharacterized protein n=1 Tax=Cerasicoccus arenae TaxID=424488 RepID=A0A8J3GC69_9BACT|nr:hypothetical protein [Cerasicoccus arenae]MBK1857095.1 hypothetical protein [Cerasicoccus arenae]GHB92337.1 hypothetical protein GCM10007047_04280 [Cerasicoccus arenae]